MRHILYALLVSFAVGCGGMGADGPTRTLPTYEGHQRELFDDSIDPSAVSMTIDAPPPPRVDVALRERTQVGDAVVRVSVETVTVKKDEREGHDVEFHLRLRVLEELVNGQLADSFVVRFDKTSPSAAIVESLGARLIGKTFVAFVRGFKDANGSLRYHAHFAPDAKDVISAVLAATAS